MAITVKGHVKQAAELSKSDAQQRREAEQGAHTFLTSADIQGNWDANRVLMTTLGDNQQLRPIDHNDLAAFRRNMELAKKAFKGFGISPRQVLDLAAGRALKYKHPHIQNAVSDLDKAKRQIKTAAVVSAKSDLLRFMTNSSEKSKTNRHFINIQLSGWNECLMSLAGVENGNKQAIRKAAQWLRKQKVTFECDCERHRYFFRYLATIGGFSYGRQEHGFPKITNPKLKGVACMHVIRVMNELDSSQSVLSFLERHIGAAHRSDNAKANTRLSQKEVDAMAAKRTRSIKTSDDRSNDARKARERRAAIKAAKQAKRMKAAAPAATRRYQKLIESGEISVDDLIRLLVKNNIVEPKGIK